MAAPMLDLTKPRHIPMHMSVIYAGRVARVIGRTLGPNPRYDLLDADGNEYRDVYSQEII